MLALDAMERGEGGVRAYNLGNANGTTVMEVIRAVEEVGGVPLSPKRNPAAWAAGLGAMMRSDWVTVGQPCTFYRCMSIFAGKLAGEKLLSTMRLSFGE